MKRFVVICMLSMLCHPVFAQEAAPDGKALYLTFCAQCHGPDLTGANAPSLVDGVWKFGDGADIVFAM